MVVRDDPPPSLVKVQRRRYNTKRRLNEREETNENDITRLAPSKKSPT